MDEIDYFPKRDKFKSRKDLGSDWKNKNYFKQLNVTQEFLDEIDCNILFMPYTESISTTEIIKRIETQNGKNDS